MVDKNYCMSSYLALRYVEREGVEFADGLRHQCYRQYPASLKAPVADAAEVDLAIKNVFHLVGREKLGILLSGGMDSACLAAYMPRGADAYTFRFLGGAYQEDELRRAELYATTYALNLHYVDIEWSIVESAVDACMKSKDAPVHSIEPQVYFAARQAKEDGVTMMVIGDGADYVFGGMDGLLSKDWGYNEYIQRVIYTNPRDVLVEPTDLNYLFERYRLGLDSIDYLRFYDEVITDESYASYENAFHAAGLPYVDPYEKLKMSRPLDLERIRRGDTKYIVRDLFRMKYPQVAVPEKKPMPRPVDKYFENWQGVTRPEFRKDINYAGLSGNQKWQLFCLERFLNTIRGEK